MDIIHTSADFLSWKKNNAETLGFVPTLGALHEGHFSLVRSSKKTCKLTAVSIFLNPTQFAAHEDLKSYPNTLEEDIKYLQDLKVDVLFLPTKEHMYNEVGAVHVPTSDLFNKLEGASRPHFFHGVTTIVAKLFNVILPTHTFFGEKDAQQLFIIKEMIKNMHYPITLIPCPTVRDSNGLALSSRNQYLSKKECLLAAVIYKSLMHIKEDLQKGQSNVMRLKAQYINMVHEVPGMKVDYISITLVSNLKDVHIVNSKEVLISTAVYFKDVRLIDNFIYLSSAI
tara:strand:+ start:450 stop:1298 length:849 start_codon:yes stop_codon:yes gene_type:complete